jgi:hypothetical protein
MRTKNVEITNLNKQKFCQYHDDKSLINYIQILLT